MEYVYQAIFHKNENNSYTIIFPDLPGCISEGKSLANAMYMAERALFQWIEYLTNQKIDLPEATNNDSHDLKHNEFINYIRVEIKNTRAVRRTVSIPKWLDEKAINENISLSGVLQEALNEKFSDV